MVRNNHAARREPWATNYSPRRHWAVDRLKIWKRVNEHGAEYWSARDLQALLGCGQWRRFEEAIGRARTSCEQSGNPAENHFAGAGKMVLPGQRQPSRSDRLCLSRFWLSDCAERRSAQPEIALAHFAIQARRQELSDALVRTANGWSYAGRRRKSSRALSGAAKQAGG